MGYKIDLWTYGATSKEQVQNAWLAGMDFVIVQSGQHCSIHNYKDLKELADRINLRYLDNEHFKYVNIWTHPLAGLTTYI